MTVAETVAAINSSGEVTLSLSTVDTPESLVKTVVLGVVEEIARAVPISATSHRRSNERNYEI